MPGGGRVNRIQNGKFLGAFLLTMTLALGILIGTVVSDETRAERVALFGSAAQLSVPNAIPSSNSFAAIVNRTEPAVVNISTTQVIDRRSCETRGRMADLGIVDRGWRLTFGHCRAMLGIAPDPG